LVVVGVAPHRCVPSTDPRRRFPVDGDRLANGVARPAVRDYMQQVDGRRPVVGGLVHDVDDRRVVVRIEHGGVADRRQPVDDGMQPFGRLRRNAGAPMNVVREGLKSVAKPSGLSSG